jgi:putative transposase
MRLGFVDRFGNLWSTMPQSLARILVHTIFSTKNRESCLTDVELRSNLYPFMGGVADKLGCDPIRIGGTADHVHLLTTLSRTTTIADLVKEVKRVSTDWIQGRGGMFSKFHWQAGYGAFSVSESKKT